MQTNNEICLHFHETCFIYKHVHEIVYWKTNEILDHHIHTQSLTSMAFTLIVFWEGNREPLILHAKVH